MTLKNRNPARKCGVFYCEKIALRRIMKSFTFVHMAAKVITHKLYADIKKDFAKYSNIKEFGVQKFTNDWVFGFLGDKYYKSPKTIENVVFNRVALNSADTSQIKLF